MTAENLDSYAGAYREDFPFADENLGCCVPTPAIF
jgi:hypothetical protein